MSDCTPTYAARAAYWAGTDTARWAAEVAIQLTRMNPPSTSNHGSPSIERAIVYAAPVLKKSTSSAVNAPTAPRRWP
jgi:hypothetical protein